MYASIPFKSYLRDITWSDGLITAKDIESPASEAEMSNEMEDLLRLDQAPRLRLLRDDHVQVNVSVDEITIC